jgi:hypothetical protein
MKTYKPPYIITSKILTLEEENKKVGEKVGINRGK